MKFKRLRSADMEKMAESKYGSNKENAVIDKCRKLGAAVVIFDLLKVKHYNAIDLEKLMKATSPTIKGAAFILYNVARLQTLLATFEQQVMKGFYAPLPEFDQIDFGLLKTEVRLFVCLFYFLISYQFVFHLNFFLLCLSFENHFKIYAPSVNDSNCFFAQLILVMISFNFFFFLQQEEWQMFFVYVIGFPSMLERCVNGIANGQISIHLVCTFLINLSALFSVYYHRVKILTVKSFTMSFSLNFLQQNE